MPFASFIQMELYNNHTCLSANQSDCFFVKFNQNGHFFTFEGVGCDSNTGMCPYNNMMKYLNNISYKQVGFDAKTAKNNCH